MPFFGYSFRAVTVVPVLEVVVDEVLLELLDELLELLRKLLVVLESRLLLLLLVLTTFFSRTTLSPDLWNSSSPNRSGSDTRISS